MKWKTLESKELFAGSFFRLRTDKCELPDGRKMPSYYVVEMTDWVNVVPITSDGQVILIRQYRYAAEDVCLEIPGGTTKLNSTEQPLVAAKRELLEETGYESKNWRSLGFHYPNPALQNNRMHTFLAVDCEKTGEQNLDPYEDIEIILATPAETIDYLRSGKIQHSIVAASLVLALGHIEAL